MITMVADTLDILLSNLYSSMVPWSQDEIQANIHGVSLNLHVYKLSEYYTLDTQDKVNKLFSYCTSLDCATQVILCTNLTICNGVKLTPPLRCKGLVIYVDGKIVNNGTISMTQRGCIAVGDNIYLYKNDDSTYEYIPAIGASGGSRVKRNKEGATPGNAGYNGINRQTGGGGSGMAFRGASYNYTVYSGAGATGTSYSGGSGGGGISAREKNWTGNDGAPNGGAGGDGRSSGGTGGYAAGGGAGNPGGYSTNTNNKHTMTYKGQDGTGGLLILYTRQFDNEGTIESKGSSGGRCNSRVPASGGSSGGGSVNIFYEHLLNKGTITAQGGVNTGNGIGPGGDGCVTLTNFVMKKSKYTEYRTNSNLYKNCHIQEVFDFNQLID